MYYYIFFISLIFFGISLIHIGAPSSIISEAHGSTNYFNNFKGSLDNKIFTVFLFLAPFFILPVLSKRWLILMVPFFFLSIFSGYPDYAFPNGEFYQYYSAIIPFLYLGFIDVLSNLEFSEKHSIKNNILKIKKHLSSKSKIVVTTFIIIILLALFYEPYGPFNNDTSANFNLQNTLNYNVSQYNDLNAVVNLIPKNDPYILYQENMPEVNFRDPIAQDGYISYSPTNHSFFINNEWTKNIDYIIIDPYSWSWFISGGANNSIYSVFNYYLLNGNYGIRAEYDNIVLLEKDYSGKATLYKNDIYINTFKNPLIINSNNSKTFLTNYISLQPGNYTVSLCLYTDNLSRGNYININMTYLYEFNHKNWNKFALFNISSENIKTVNNWKNITFNINIPIEIAGVNLYVNKYNGSNYFEIKSINIVQNNYYK